MPTKAHQVILKFNRRHSPIKGTYQPLILSQQQLLVGTKPATVVFLENFTKNSVQLKLYDILIEPAIVSGWLNSDGMQAAC